MTNIKSSSAMNVLDAAQMAHDRNRVIGAFFYEYRKLAGLSAEDVAKQVESIDSATLLQYESGAQAMPLEDVFVLTNLLNIPPEEVLSLISDVYTKVRI